MTVRCLVSVCPSVRMEQLGSQRRDFHEICYFSIFRDSVEKFKVLLKSDKLNPLTPNVNYSGRTAPLTSKVAFYTFIQQI